MSMVLNSLEVLVQNDSEVVATAAAGTEVMRVDSNGLVMASGYDMKQGSNIYHDKVILSFQYNASVNVGNVLDGFLFVPMEGSWKLEAAAYMPQVAGTNGGAVTMDLTVTSGVQAPSAGTTQLDSTIDLKATAYTKQVADIIAAPTEITLGKALAVDFTGTLTAVEGTLCVSLVRVS